ncbi:MAG TPA: hypothetical protein VMV55_00805 [Methanoregula sp.]|nr:hypothetical protein [Methanoregula sp.]
MNKRTISALILLRILAGLLILVKAVVTVIATGKMAVVPSLTTPEALPAGNSPAIAFHPRHISRNKTMIKGG